MTVPETTLNALKLAGQAAADKQATDIVAVDVAQQMGLTDAFLLASAGSERQVVSVVDEIEDALTQQLGLDVLRREGKAGGRWVLLDYGHLVVHVQHEEERVFYALDRLWKDSPLIDLGLTDGVAADEGGSTVDPDAGPRDWTPDSAQD
ncbi:ribosome silencing factor [Citricoccus nitrophenolicus]|uniref:Ribosomal silencing factor RsfS n=1 Tax=Citricoccus nitrophenolicus TaxID=863575 RepID=A0ABV0IDW5_9MICC|nr:ribosome silencing factor [Citricoccus sp. I39-566]WMY77188.1 ribosome silencing factor [Citricoccus sp. I39-566]